MNEPNQDNNILDRIKGRKKKMYLSILELLAGGNTEEETGLIISKVFHCHLTQGRIAQIKKSNQITLDELTLQSELATKSGRLRYAFRKLKKKDINGSKKDSLDWLDYLRKEVEGDSLKVKGNNFVSGNPIDNLTEKEIDDLVNGLIKKRESNVNQT